MFTDLGNIHQRSAELNIISREVNLMVWYICVTEFEFS